MAITALSRADAQQQIKITLSLKLSLTALTADRHAAAALRYYYSFQYFHPYLLQRQQ